MAESGLRLLHLEPLHCVNACCFRAPSLSLNKPYHIRAIVRDCNARYRGHSSQPVVVRLYNDNSTGSHASSAACSLFPAMSASSSAVSSFASPSSSTSASTRPSTSPLRCRRSTQPSATQPSTSASASQSTSTSTSTSTSVSASQSTSTPVSSSASTSASTSALAPMRLSLLQLPRWASLLISSSSSLPSTHPWTASLSNLRNVKDEYHLNDQELPKWARARNHGKERMSDNVLNHFLKEIPLAARKGLMVFIILTTLLTTPSVTLTHGVFDISNGVAFAQPTSQIRQLALFLERLAEGNASSRIIDRLVTVISGQTVVTPETVEQLKSVINGEKDLTDLQADLADNSEDFWPSIVDALSNMDPLSLIDSAGTSIQGLFEIAAERVAAFELSTLVSLGERWLIWTPFVMIPMLWQMSRNSEKEDGDDRRKTGTAVELSAEAQAKALRVKEELERIELKSSLLKMVSDLGKLAWQSSSNADQAQTRKEISRILERLQQLNPSISNSINSNRLMSALNVDGDWTLIYVSDALGQSRPQQFLEFRNLDLFGVEVSDRRQKVWRRQSRASATSLDEDDEAGEPMKAKNTAKVRLGPLAVMEVSVEGTWKSLKNSQGSASVSFQTILARPIEIFGSHLREDLPLLGISIPITLQSDRQWETVYLDKSLRVHRGSSSGQTFVFQKVL